MLYYIFEHAYAYLPSEVVTQLIIMIIGFIALSGLMAMVDAAVLSVSRIEIEEMMVHKKWGSHSLSALSTRITRAVSVIVIITNTVNILGPILVGAKAIAIFGDEVIGVITAVLTFGTILFSEIIPKSIGAHNAPLISRVAAPFLLTLTWVLLPLVWSMEQLTSPFRKSERALGTEEQIRSLATIGRTAGHIESNEGQLIHRAFLLNDRTAKDVMTPLKDIVGVFEAATVREAADKVFHHSYSRYPVFGTSLHEVKGLIMSQDILEALSAGKDTEPVANIMRAILIVKGSKPCNKLMVHFRDKRIHLAIVQEQGKTIGLVTLEDVLEELVGEIEDESDVED